jgi:transcription initiation factor TFIIIB Brf1 subunit/transcription initiation factor TFIIB
MDRCHKCGSKNLIFDEKFAEYICKDCLEVYYLEEIIENDVKE